MLNPVLGASLLPKKTPTTAPPSALPSGLPGAMNFGGLGMGLTNMNDLQNLPPQMLQEIVQQISTNTMGGQFPMTGLPFGLPPAPGPTPPTPQQPVMKPTVVPSKVSDMHPYPKEFRVENFAIFEKLTITKKYREFQ